MDLTLRIAGPGTRAYAYIIDWHLRVLLVLAWVALFLLLQKVGVAAPGTFGVVFWVPAVVIYLIYHPLLEVLMRGITPGKRMAGARIVTQEGATPGTGALIIRNVFRAIDWLPSLYMVGLACCFWTAQRVRFGDLAAGTVLVVNEPKAARSLDVVGALAGTSRLDPNRAALVRDVLDRWREMGAREAAALARDILVRLDGGLDALQIQRIDPHSLRARLQGLLDGSVPVRGQPTPAAGSRLDSETASQVRDLLGRWAQMSSGQAAERAREILVGAGQLDPFQTPAPDEAALRARLERLLGSA